MQTWIYARLSDNPGGRSIGLAQQEVDARALAKTLDATVARVVIDDDLTAANPDITRPGFEEVLDAVLLGDAECVIAYDQHRFLRLGQDLERVIRTFIAAGAQLHYVSGISDLESPEGRLYARINTTVGTFEAEKVSARTRRNMARRAELGLPLSGAAGFGFTKPAGVDNYETVPAEADAIRDAARAIIGGASLRAVAGQWNDAGFTTRPGGKWTAGGVRRVLIAPRTAGLRVHKGHIVGKAAWPAILDERTWKRVRRVLSAPERRTAVSYDAHLLTGIATCGACGRGLNSSRARQGHRIYQCRHCLRISIRADGLEAMAEQLICEHVDSEDVDAHLAEPDTDDRAAELQARLDELDGDLVDLADRYGRGDIGRAEWERARAGFESRRLSVARELEELERAPMVWPRGTGSVFDDWSAMTLAEQRAVARHLLVVFEVRPARKGRVPFDRSRVRWKLAERGPFNQIDRLTLA